VPRVRKGKSADLLHAPRLPSIELVRLIGSFRAIAPPTEPCAAAPRSSSEVFNCTRLLMCSEALHWRRWHATSRCEQPMAAPQQALAVLVDLELVERERLSTRRRLHPQQALLPLQPSLPCANCRGANERQDIVLWRQGTSVAEGLRVGGRVATAQMQCKRGTGWDPQPYDCARSGRPARSPCGRCLLSLRPQTRATWSPRPQ
jgi:hypothetical protein